MGIDVSTLFMVTIEVEVILSLLLLLVWVQNREIYAVLWWSSAHIARAGSILLFGFYEYLPSVITIDLANALVLCSFALTWTGARIFGGRRVLPFYIGYGAFVWLCLSHIAIITRWPDLRALVSVSVVAAYAWLTAYELWRNRTESLISRWPAIFILFVEGATFLLRTPLSTLLPWSPTTQIFGSIWPTILSSEALLLTISIAFILLAMAKERAEQRHRIAATVDQLTGIANRRGFLAACERLQADGTSSQPPFALLLIDLDHFKLINDRYGHAFGDDVLRVFAKTVSGIISHEDIFGRLGGEEFAVVLARADALRAHEIAERIRSEFASAAYQVNGQPASATISIGLVMSNTTVSSITDLLANADRALYRAKSNGRNRIEIGIVDVITRYSAGSRKHRDGVARRPAA
jgi:diguanylate cyclase (GGDEF)-like protein